MKKLELLAPAGDLEKLKIAIEYGADAVYFGGEMYGLRAGARNLNAEEIEAGVAFAHERGKKAYLAVNIFAHNEDIEGLSEYLKTLGHIPIDAYIVSDPGVIELIREISGSTAVIHLSTQANSTNYRSARFWHAQGVKRIVLARELSIEEIRMIREKTDPELELEAFVQGAMCISYSGRCLLSNFMIERDANRGECAHPCRWSYHLVEEKRPGEYYPVFEDDRGTYVFNSKDLCMLEHLPVLAEAGVSSFKIEGRMKSVFYVATIVGAYRRALDAYQSDPVNYRFDPELMSEIKKVSHRKFSTGFNFGKPSHEDQNYITSSYMRAYEFIGLVKAYDSETGIATVEQRNKIGLHDEVEIFGPYTGYFKQTIDVLLDENNDPIEAAPHAQQIVKIKMKNPVKENFIIRRRSAVALSE